MRFKSRHRRHIAEIGCTAILVSQNMCQLSAALRQVVKVTLHIFQQGGGAIASSISASRLGLHMRLSVTLTEAGRDGGASAYFCAEKEHRGFAIGGGLTGLSFPFVGAPGS